MRRGRARRVRRSEERSACKGGGGRTGRAATSRLLLLRVPSTFPLLLLLSACSLLARPEEEKAPARESVLRAMAAEMDPNSEQGLLKNEVIPEIGEDAAASVNVAEALSEEEQEELRRELAKVEEEIQTLSQVLAAKEKHLAEIKRKLGISSLQELRQNLSKGWQDVTATNAYKKTSETLSQAGQKASAAFSTVGSAITKKLEDVNIRCLQHSISMPAMRNSPTFKSFEEKVENLKYKVGGTKPPGGDFGEVLNSAANASATEATTKQTEEETQ
ncbi:tumor protein D52 isoform X2 [Lacerta agilis]|uniref:tumor protein D52 isoform X2 n=1 Tax=Lacerta agilis TaxID=80427 RepID=UPI001419F694|nr:tumor protein D52 isoform X2 [Lacerta agilis]